jgi:agmatinase
MSLLDQAENLAPGTVVVVGVPYDEQSSFLRGPAEAPPRIREALHSPSTNLSAENGIDFADEPRLCDLGDLGLGDGPAAMDQIEETIAALLARDLRVLALGGDHAVTYPIVKAHALAHAKLNILHLDAHPDIYDTYEGNPLSHACPFARIIEQGLAARLVQVGVRTTTPRLRHQIERFGVEVIEMRHWRPGIDFDFGGPVYLSLDMDVLDPAFAPGVSHHEPGGMSTRDVLDIIQGIRSPIVGADIVEYNPRRDPTGVTAMVAAKFVKEIAAQMLVVTNRRRH